MISDYMYKTNKDNKKGQVGKLAAIILILAGAIIMYMYLTQFMGKNTFTEAIKHLSSQCFRASRYRDKTRYDYFRSKKSIQHKLRKALR